MLGCSCPAEDGVQGLSRAGRVLGCPTLSSGSVSSPASWAPFSGFLHTCLSLIVTASLPPPSHQYLSVLTLLSSQRDSPLPGAVFSPFQPKALSTLTPPAWLSPRPLRPPSIRNWGSFRNPRVTSCSWPLPHPLTFGASQASAPCALPGEVTLL